MPDGLNGPLLALLLEKEHPVYFAQARFAARNLSEAQFTRRQKSGGDSMRRGRPRKPIKLHILQGTLRPDRHNLNEPKPEAEIPDCPPHLQGEAREEWNRITSELSGLNIISKLDRAALTAYCFSYAQWVEACEKLKDGVVEKQVSFLLELNVFWWLAFVGFV
jgi:hypothetical protein